MIRAFEVAEVREAERAAMAQVPTGELMQRAAAQVARVATKRVRGRGGGRVVVLAGGGDNGGDALFAAAMLAQEGVPVAVVAVTDRLHPDGEVAVQQAGLPLLRLVETGLTDVARETLAEADLVIDGMLGIGGRPGLPPVMAEAVRAIPEASYVLAVDLPSGADPAGLVPLGEAVWADETVTFSLAKPVHLLPATSWAVGRLTVADIGVVAPEVAVVERLSPADVAERWPVPLPGDDKYSRGVLGVVAGSDRYPGAAVLTASAAVETGVGMVRYVGPATPTAMVLAACPEVVPGTGRVQAWVLGPGLDADSLDAEVEALLRAALASELPCLVDAGALDLLDGRRPAPTLATPHAGELARLLTRLESSPVTREQVEADPVQAGRRAADLTGATVLLKGATTLVIPPAGAMRSQADGPAWLATAGSGDVLAGIAGALLAAGLDPLTAGSLGALVHGAAARRANPGGPVRASAVARAVPVTVAALLDELVG